MTRRPHDEGAEETPPAQRPSKSARKRAAHAAQDLGEALVALTEAELTPLPLPDELLEAIRAARRIKSRAALSRQRQYIGRLMRELDTAPINAALEARRLQAARESERAKRAEAWRERLIDEGDAALGELLELTAGLDERAWRDRVSAARAERARDGASGRAARELFRALRALFATMP